MHVYSRLPIYESERTTPRGRDDSRGCKGVSDGNLQTKKETRRSDICRTENLGDIAQTVSLRKIVTVTAKHLDIPTSVILGRRRTADISYARTLCYLLSANLTGYSLSAISRSFDRDYSTIVHMYKQAKARLKTDEQFARDYNTIVTRLSE
jgi:chromosomal replication initiation ATPase DnaA